MTTLIKIGNSQGVKIPKNLIKKAHLENTKIDFEIKDEGLLLKPILTKPRSDWEEKIKKELENKNIKDELLDFDLDTKIENGERYK